MSESQVVSWIWESGTDKDGGGKEEGRRVWVDYDRALWPRDSRSRRGRSREVAGRMLRMAGYAMLRLAGARVYRRKMEGIGKWEPERQEKENQREQKNPGEDPVVSPRQQRELDPQGSRYSGLG